MLIAGANFSPNSDFIYYTAYKKNDSPPQIGSLYKIPILGGAPQEILKDIDSPVAISNDNKKLAFIRNKIKNRESALIISDADGSNEKELVVKKFPDRFSTRGLSWSPDDKFISSGIIEPNDEKVPTKLAAINSENGEQKILTNRGWLWIGKTAWLKDGSGIAMVAYGPDSPNITDEIWFISYPEGKPRLITNGIKGLNGISLTDDSNSILATKLTRITSSYVSQIDDLDNATEIAKTIGEESLLPLGTVWTNDGKILYSKTQNGNADIWMMNSDGTDRKQVTSDKSADFSPKISENGYVFFLSNRSGTSSIWRSDTNGENPLEIIKGRNLSPPTILDDKKLIYYSATTPNNPYNVLWKAGFDGKNPEQITSSATYFPQISPNGKYVFCFYSNTNDMTTPLKLTVLSTEDGKVFKQFEDLKSRTFPIVRWKNDNSGFLILERINGDSVLSEQMLNEEKPTKLKTWKSETIYQIAVSKNSNKFFYEKGKEVNSVVQFKDISSE